MSISSRAVGIVSTVMLVSLAAPVFASPGRGEQPRTFQVEAKTRRADDRSERHKKLWTATEQRLTRAIERHERVVVRLNTYIANHPNQDTAAAKATLAKASAALTEARADLAEAKTLFADFVKAEKPRDAFPALRTKVQEVIAQIQEAHKLIRQAIRELDLKPTSTSTSTHN